MTEETNLSSDGQSVATTTTVAAPAPAPTSPPAGTISVSNPNPAVAVNPDNAKPQTPDPKLQGYSALKKAMTEAGHVMSEGEGLLISEFDKVRGFLNTHGFAHIGDEWHMFEHAVANGAHALAAKVTPEAAHLEGLTKNDVETETDELTGKIKAVVADDTKTAVDSTEAEAKKLADAAAADAEAKAKADSEAAEGEAKKLAAEAEAEAKKLAAEAETEAKSKLAQVEADAKKLVESTPAPSTSAEVPAKADTSNETKE